MTNVKLVLKAALIVLCIAACTSVPSVISEPSVSFDSVSMKGLNFTGADMVARIKVQNDNPVSIPFPEMNWNLFVTEASFLSGVIKKNSSIAARGSTIVELPFTVTYEGLYKTVSNLINADEAPYRIDLASHFSLPVLGNKTFNTSFSGVLPMLKVPALSFSGVKFNSITLTKVEFVLTWLVDNKNSFAFSLDKLDYNFAVNGASWTTGSAPRASLSARRTTQVPVTVNISSLSMIQEIVSLATGGKTVNYTCGGEAALMPQGFENIAALRLPFNYSGNTTIKR